MLLALGLRVRVALFLGMPSFLAVHGPLVPTTARAETYETAAIAGIAERGSSGSSTNAVTISGSNCVPEQRSSSAIASSGERFANPYTAAERGYVDEVIEPRRTRPVLIDALETALTKQEVRPRRKHGNIPL